MSSGKSVESPHSRLYFIVGALLVLWVQRRELFSFFSPDDLIHLQQALDLRPTPLVPWRLLTQVAYFRATVRVVGLNPLPYMAVNLALHLLNTWLAFRFMRLLHAPRHVAFLASVGFGSFPLLVTVLGRAVTINDILALTFTLLMFLALQHRGWVSRLGAPIAFLLALLSKESVLFMPLLALGIRTPGEKFVDVARRVAGPLILMTASGALFLALRTGGLAPGGVPYTMRFGSNLFHNLMTYASWSVDLRHAIPDLVRSFSRNAWHVGLPVIVVMLGTSMLCRTQGRLVLLGLAWWVIGLLPVLPLENSTYGHYMYASMVGFMLAAASTISCIISAPQRRARPDEATEPRPANSAPRRASRWRVAVFVVLAVVYALRANALIAARYQQAVNNSDLPLDPFLRATRVAQMATWSLGNYVQPDDHKIAVIIPAGTTQTFGARSGRQYDSVGVRGRGYDLIEAVTDSGRAFRLWYPQLDSILFTQEWTRSDDDFALFMEGHGGTLIGFGRGADAEVRLAQFMLMNHWYEPARRHLSSALDRAPDDSRLRLAYSCALLGAGDTASAIVQLRQIVRRDPADSIAVVARDLLVKARQARIRSDQGRLSN